MGKSIRHKWVNSKFQASISIFCSWSARFVSDPEGRFSRDGAHNKYEPDSVNMLHMSICNLSMHVKRAKNVLVTTD